MDVCAALDQHPTFSECLDRSLNPDFDNLPHWRQTVSLHELLADVLLACSGASRHATTPDSRQTNGELVCMIKHQKMMSLSAMYLS